MPSVPRHCWGRFFARGHPTKNNGAIRHKLAIDLQAQAKHFDVFSIMP